MNGAVIPNTPIAVDFWRLRRCPHSRIFFLSHLHADHTAGLTSSWNSSIIYCSEITRKLAIAKLGLKSELVVGLPLDEVVIINLDEIGRETMTVTLIDANHCPGSVMFIFEGYFGKILYTGDFRFCERFLTHSAIRGKQFDILYLDNTYCDPKCFFPTRSCATITILEIIRNHPQHKIVIGLHNLGKEVLLRTIAMTCKAWIGVDPLRMKTLELLEMPDVFTCDVDSARIRVVKTQEITKRNIQMWNSEQPTIAILPTCLYVGAQNPYENVPNVFVVPYSDHCSFEELRKFVQSVKPRKVIPIVHKHRLAPGETINSRVNMNIFQHLMESSPSAQYKVPSSVENFMAAKVMQEQKKRAKATRQICLRKVPKHKKPCGVVFPLSLEMTEAEEKNCLVGHNSDEISKMDLDDVLNDAAEEISIDKGKLAASASVKEDCDSEGKVRVENVVNDKNIVMEQETNGERNAVSTCVKTDDECKPRKVLPAESFGELRYHVDSSTTDADEQKTSKRKMFNIYTGCSCDFARKVIEDMMQNGAVGDN